MVWHSWTARSTWRTIRALIAEVRSPRRQWGGTKFPSVPSIGSTASGLDALAIGPAATAPAATEPTLSDTALGATVVLLGVAATIALRHQQA